MRIIFENYGTLGEIEKSWEIWDFQLYQLSLLKLKKREFQ